MCEWATTNSLLTVYHDKEWGVPEHDDDVLFEHLTLDCFQAGLSWLTILKKRENFRIAFDHFRIGKVAAFDDAKIQKLLEDPSIIRNKMKIEASIQNAKQVLQLQKNFGSFDDFIWQFTKGETVHNAFKTMAEIPPRSLISDKMSADLKKLGFKFVGSTICYAFMQSVGMVNDHIISCPRYHEVKAFRK